MRKLKLSYALVFALFHCPSVYHVQDLCTEARPTSENSFQFCQSACVPQLYITSMAPVARRTSAAAPLKKGANNRQTRKARKNRPPPLKSAIRHRLEVPVKAKQVNFLATDNDGAAQVHLLQEHARSAPLEESTRTPLEHSKRKQQEELLKRAARILGTSTEKGGGLPTPPRSPGGRTSPFDEPHRAQDEEQIDDVVETEKQALTKNADTLTEVTLPKKGGFVRATSRHIDAVMDDIPTGLEMPATIENILIEPGCEIKMEEICTAFDFLKAQIQTYCRDHYSYDRPAADEAIPCFTYLRVKHIELFRYIQYVADGSQYGWEKLINVGPQRENLVYGIISRALIAHVFDTELFGASAEHEEAFLEMCREYLYFDAFVRNTHRAELVLAILLREAEENSVSGKSPYTYFTAALRSLEERIGLLLQPLQKPIHASSTPLSQTTLRSILQTSLKIHLAIRLAGSNGTVYRFEHSQKFSPWDSQTMNCINQRRMDLTAHHGEDPLVKISCFPAVFSTVPSGPNLESFTDPAFVEEWKKTADPDDEERGDKPIITTYTITLADVVLENTPTADRSGFLSLTQTMAREQAKMSNQDFYSLTGIDRTRNKRVNKIAKRARSTVRGLSLTLAAAAASWYLYRNRDDVTPVLGRLLKRTPELVLGTFRSMTGTAIKPKTKTTTSKTTMTLTAETPPAPAAAFAFITPALAW